MATLIKNYCGVRVEWGKNNVNLFLPGQSWSWNYNNSTQTIEEFIVEWLKATEIADPLGFAQSFMQDHKKYLKITKISSLEEAKHFLLGETLSFKEFQDVLYTKIESPIHFSKTQGFLASTPRLEVTYIIEKDLFSIVGMGAKGKGKTFDLAWENYEKDMQEKHAYLASLEETGDL